MDLRHFLIWLLWATALISGIMAWNTPPSGWSILALISGCAGLWVWGIREETRK